MSNMGQVIMVAVSFLLMVGYNAYLFISSLWDHQAPSLAEFLFSVITVLVMYITGSYRG